ncbi:VOC family protein [Brooklawnia cerclae]|uniref:VOC domain-containing protein n=1 Tax=Brooklawnia cerclae TaxID=349934 RepID=A0ABX0SEK7_9ACTN|nr:VOC family protein [Brooklawnia cerclae]NIH56799.1 hypothetical protein [Brooklawnia cerclae]
MARPIHFEIHCDDLDRGRAFYADVFGWTFEDYSAYAGTPYFGIVTGSDDDPGINGGMLARPEGSTAGPGAPVNGAVLTIGSGDFDADAARILAAGGQVALPKAALPGMAWQGYFLDTEGNVFGLHQPDPDAR